MPWQDIAENNANLIKRFVEIMRQMDAAYDGLTTDVIVEWLTLPSEYRAFYFDNPLDTEIVLLVRTREAKHPDVVMLGWIPSDPVNVSDAEYNTSVTAVITKIRDWADGLAPAKNTVRVVCPKRIGYVSMRRLHERLQNAITTAGGIAQLARPAIDLGDSQLWYVKKQ